MYKFHFNFIPSLAWIKEISAAARGENLFEEVDYPACYQVLGLSINDNPAPQDINRAYRKMALKCHPDKGGDMIEVRRVLNHSQTD